MSNISFRELGLTTEEAEALIAVSKARMGEVDAVVGSYVKDEDSRTVKKLNELIQKNEISLIRAQEIRAIRNIANLQVANFTPFSLKTEMKDDYFTKHESFGCIYQSIQQSTHPEFVGTPTLDHSMIVLSFQHASFDTDSHNRSEARLREGSYIAQVSLSSDQFAGLLRNRRSESPCALNRMHSYVMDTPPRMVATTLLAEEARAEALQITDRLTKSAHALHSYLVSSEKISTKADYAHLKSLTDDVKSAMAEVAEPLRELMQRTAGQMASASTKQLLMEIVEPLAALGMDSEDLLRRLN
ncbi:hypothetical protein ACI2KR_31665 [Pseudomonas luteola]